MLGAILLTIMKPASFADELEGIRARYGLPSLCAGAVVGGKIVAIDAVGVRRLGEAARVTTADRYHLGSNTKAFTAALAGLLVQRGKLAWDTPLAQIFPDLVATMNPAYRTVTPLLLMAHRSGLTGETYSNGMPDWGQDDPLPVKRAAYVRAALTEPPVSPPGTRFEYSNRGYVVLGAALERLTHRSWEDLTTAEILKPLGLKSAGFGAADAKDKAQPVGHAEQDGRLVPQPGSDNLPVIGPAGTLHMSVPDMLRWCAFQADEGRKGGLLTPATFEVLHTPAVGDYAGGFRVVPRGWAGGAALYHAGSNTMNYQTVWIAPAKRFAVVVATNCVVKDVAKATDEACAILIARFCPK